MADLTANYAPKYIKVKQYLLDYFKQNNVKPDDRLPSENDLVKIFNVSRITVRQAIDILAKEGIIYRVQGKGTFFRGQAKHTTNNIIGVVSPVTSQYIYIDIMKGIEEFSHSKNYSIIIGNSSASPQKEIAAIESMLQRGIDGLLIEPALSGLITEESEIFKMLADFPVPVVIFDCNLKGLDIPFVDIDDFKAGYNAARYLIEKGHRKIAFIFKKEVLGPAMRFEGYRQALLDSGIRPEESYCLGFQEKDEYPVNTVPFDLTTRLLELKDPPTAIFYYNDESALLGSHAIEKKGLNIPGDISILGFDDSEHALYTKVPLTTFIHPKKQMGELAAQMLIQEIQSPGHLQNRNVLFTPHIVERESVRAL